AVAQPGFTKTGKGLAFYGSPTKAYTMDTQSNQILVSTVVNSTGPSNYLKQNVDLSKAQDIAIDGAVYVLYPDKILKFVSGTEKTFASSGTYSSDAKIFANNSWRFVYVIDPAAKKITVLDKNGNVKVQYTSDKFDNMKDAVI